MAIIKGNNQKNILGGGTADDQLIGYLTANLFSSKARQIFCQPNLSGFRYPASKPCPPPLSLPHQNPTTTWRISGSHSFMPTSAIKTSPLSRIVSLAGRVALPTTGL
ncbi:hypothetical protein [Methylovulum miyakonense]|uniref:hypothetical protein n=1 Tax=Methylovulum miyakonense TaxID=645578 RepID=UPI0012EB6F61|nr:hypothetical protein [Methylovulum miyakonense]